MIKQAFHKYFELMFWTSALISLALTNPGGETHFSLCPLKMLGISWCPGCGLGHAISFFLHGDITRSFHAHWFGIPAFFIIIFRIYTLVRQRFFSPAQLRASSFTV